ncbi:MAG TPA: MBL fold metallo-hydrolase [Gemmataceae bacterium]|nr:MBL fold metallo-hydrolase [Gemmataceae bacterium]
MHATTSAPRSGQNAFTITYWGVTGTLTTPLRPAEVTDKLVAALRFLIERGRLADLRPGPDLESNIRRLLEEELPFHQRSSYGGNTTCVEVQTPDALLILDCGSGFRELGISLATRWQSKPSGAERTAHVLVSHPHIDHIYATPYFLPYYDLSNHFTIYGSPDTLHNLGVLFNPQSEMSRRYFPPTFEQMKALEDFRSIPPGSEFQIGSTHIRTHALTHPGGCLAYRLENAGRVFVFATDHEQVEAPDRGLAEFARGADLLYTEGQYTCGEYEGRDNIGISPPLSRLGWGHSTIEACVSTAVAAGVRELHVGHRDPARSDENIARLEFYLCQCLREELGRAGRAADSCRARIVHEGLVVRC